VSNSVIDTDNGNVIGVVIENRIIIVYRIEGVWGRKIIKVTEYP